MTDLPEVSPHLPAIPVRAHSPGRKAHKLSQAVQVAMNGTEWEQMVAAARADHGLGRMTVTVHYPGEDAPGLFGRTNFRLDDLRPGSQWVYARVQYLVRTIQHALSDQQITDPELNQFGEMLQRMGARITWDAFLDLCLADHLLDAGRYDRGSLGPVPERLRPALTPGVSELRGCVLYAIRALTTIHNTLLHHEVTARLRSERVIMPRVDEAMAYFESYVQAYLELTRPAAPELPAADSSSWWRRWLQS